MANFIIITGPPGSGKTTLASSISKKLKLPLFSKDTFKCLMADYISGEGLEYTQSLGRSSIEILNLLLNELAKNSGTYIFESAFLKKYEDDFFSKFNEDEVKLFQVYCKVNSEVSFDRIKSRLELEKRHTCHQDHLRLNDIKKSIEDGNYEKLQIQNGIDVQIEDGFSDDLVIEKIRDFLVRCSNL
ncbi:MAG: AAA family ATPase [Bacteriovoracaceae bacterium]|nr:AAA family ATPase [Bacteriovoracaceae bacterium]